MAKVIVVTNFSSSSRNALEYACKFLHNATTNVLLLNIFSFPGSITYNPIAIAAMGDTIADDERKLQNEYEWVRSNYPEINIHAEMVTGVFLEELYAKATEEEAVIIIVGAAGNYSELLSWDTNIIDAFVDLNIPVLIVPSKVQYQPVEKIAFAINYYRKNLMMPVSMIRRLVEFTKAKLFVITVVPPAEKIDEEAKESKRILKENLADLSPTYYEPEFRNIFSAIDNFTAAENINMMVVIPSRHGLWYNIFNQNHTKGLINLNHIPILSLRQERAFL